MDRATAIERLMNLNDDPECDHAEADKILLEFLDSNGFRDVSNAYRAMREHIGFWYA